MTETFEITDEYRFYLLRRKRSEDFIVNAFRRFREASIEPILIKGWAAERNYPPGVTRFSGDVDLAVSDSDYQRAVTLMAEEGSRISGVDLHLE